MGCGCVPPPPLFDLPPPPDPSLIWELLSDEPLVAFQKIQLQNCSVNSVFGDGGVAPLALLICLCLMVVTVASLTGALIYRKRRKQQSANPSINTSKTNSISANTVLTDHGPTNWPYGLETNRQCRLMSPSKLHQNPLFHAMPIVAATNSATLIRTLPSHQCSPALHYRCYGTPGYCTLGSQQPQYEEIGSMIADPHYAANPICCEGPILVEERMRRPPPNCRPPPPPPTDYQPSRRPHLNIHSNSGSSFSGGTDELGSSSDVELEQLARVGVHFPVEALRQHSTTDLWGRESGYGTASKGHWPLQSPPSALRYISNSTKSPQQSSTSGHSSQHNSPPQQPTRLTSPPSNSPTQNMTYV